MRRWLLLFLVAVLTYVPQLQAAAAFKKGTIIRDAEIESILRQYIDPLFKVAGLAPERLHFYIVYDPELNAFATTQYTIVLHSGLIQKAKTVGELIGVLAHETGHIGGGHLARLESAMNKSQIIGIAAAALGVLAGIATGRGDLGGALVAGGMDAVYKNLFHYSRGQESTADQSAMRYLNMLKWPAQGLVNFMEVLKQQELLVSERQDPYFRTHPLSSERVEFLKNTLKPESQNYKFPEDFERKFKIVKAKLSGYLNPPGQTFLDYSEKDSSFEARYARVLAFYRNNQTEKSLALLDQLIKENTSNPYLYELKGQILFENSRIDEAIQALETAHQHASHEALIMILLAQCLLEKKNAPDTPSGHDDRIIKLLQKALKKEEESPLPWRLLAMAYGHQKNMGMAALCLAEEALRSQKYKLAKDQAQRALLHLKDEQSGLRAQDIIRLADEELKNPEVNNE